MLCNKFKIPDTTKWNCAFVQMLNTTKNVYFVHKPQQKKIELPIQ